MKKLLPLLILTLSFSVFGQTTETNSEPIKDYSTSKPEDSIIQVLPSDEKILSEADLGNVYQSLGIIAEPEQDKYGLLFVNVQEDYQFEAQSSQLFNLYIDGLKATSTVPTVIKKYKAKKYKVEYLTVSISYDEFNKIISSTNVSIAYGKISYKLSLANLSAFFVIKDQYYARTPSRSPNTSGSTYSTPSNNGRVQVRGYYRRDGTYVRPHTRSRPRN